MINIHQHQQHSQSSHIYNCFMETDSFTVISPQQTPHGRPVLVPLQAKLTAFNEMWIIYWFTIKNQNGCSHFFSQPFSVFSFPSTVVLLLSYGIYPGVHLVAYPASRWHPHSLVTDHLEFTLITWETWIKLLEAVYPTKWRKTQYIKVIQRVLLFHQSKRLILHWNKGVSGN